MAEAFRSLPGRVWQHPTMRTVRRLVVALQTPRVRTDALRMESALVANRLHTLAWTLWAFIVGFSLDDLRMLRFPAYLAAIGGALFVFVASGPLAARAMVVRHRFDDDDAFDRRIGIRRRTGQLVLLLTVLVGVAWLILFSSGVPPWAV